MRFELGLGLRAIARSCSVGLGTAHEYLQRAEAAGVTWPLGEDWGEDRLEATLFGGPPQPRPAVLPLPDFAGLHKPRQSHPHVTQQLLWEEYRQAVRIVLPLLFRDKLMPSAPLPADWRPESIH